MQDGDKTRAQLVEELEALRTQCDALRAEAKVNHQTFFSENVLSVYQVEFEPPVPIDLPPEDQVDMIFSRGIIKDVSEMCAQIYGLTREQMIGQPITAGWAPGFEQRDSPVHQYYQQFVRAGYVDHSTEAGPGTTQEGKEAWFLVSMKGIVEDGHLVGFWGSQIDVTARKQAEQKLRDTQALQLDLINAVGDSMLLITPDGTMTLANEGLARRFGKTVDELVGSSTYDLVSEDVATRRRGFVKTVLESGEPLSVEDERDGLFIESRLFPVRDHRDEITHIGILGRDVTQRKRLEEQYRAFFKNNISPVFWIEIENPISIDLPPDQQVEAIFREGYIKDASDITALEHGLDSVEDLLGARLRALYSPESIRPGGDVYKAYDHLVRSGYELTRYEAPETSQFGDTKWFSNSTKGVVEEGRLVRIWGSFVDITDRIDHTQKLEQAETKYRTVVDNIHEGILVHSGSRKLFFNTRFAEILGYTAEEYDGLAFMERIHPDDREKVMRQQAGVLQSGQSVTHFECRIINKTGETMWIRAKATPVKWMGEPAIITFAEDISESKAANLALQESQAKIAALFENDVAALFTIRLEGGQTIAANTQAAKMYGYSSTEELIHKWRSEAHYVNPADRLPILETLRRDGRMRNVRLHTKRIDGTTFWIEASFTLRPDKAHVDIVAIDVTQRKEAETNLRDSEQRYRALFNDVPISLWEEDFSEVLAYLEGLRFREIEDFDEYLVQHPEIAKQCADLVRVTGINKTTLALHEAATENDLIEGIPQTFTEKSFETFRKQLVAIWRGDQAHESEAEIVTLRGKRLHVLIGWSVAPGHEETLSRVFVAMTDITERLRLEQTLQTETANLEAVFSSSPLLMMILDESTNIVRVNDAAIELCGCDPAEILHHRPGDVLGCVHGASAPRGCGYGPECPLCPVRRGIEGLITNGGAIDGAEAKLQLLREGELRDVWLRVFARPVSIDDRPHVCVALEDITEPKRLQVQIAQSDRLASMGMLAAGVAHEINNPLSYVLYNLESLSEDLPAFIKSVRNYQSRVTERFGHDSVEQAVGDASETMNPVLFGNLLDRFRDSLEGTRRIRDITRGLGTFSRVERDELEPVDLRHVIDAALNMCFNEIKYRARVVKDYARVPSVMGSQGRMSQVFLNLFVNAAHAIDEGDVEGNEIRIRTWTEGETVCAEIRDTGKGIAPEHIGRLFEPFFTTKDVGAGSGLGLPISKGIVESYGGEITVESSVGQGTAFVIRLPQAVEEATSRPKAVEGEDSERVWGRILVVDDEDAIRGAMVHMLRGHETVEASTGQVAKSILEEDQAFDLILSDLMMPEVSGMDLHAWLSKEHPRLARQVIFITGGAFTPKARDYLSKVDNLRLEKPFDITNFKRIVSELIWREKSGRDTIGPD